MTKQFAYIAVLTWVLLALPVGIQNVLAATPPEATKTPKLILQTEKFSPPPVRTESVEKVSLNRVTTDPVEVARVWILRVTKEMKGVNEAASIALATWTASPQFLTTLRQAIENNEIIVLYSVLPKTAAEFGAIEELENSLGLSRQPLREMHPWTVTVSFEKDGTPRVSTTPLAER